MTAGVLPFIKTLATTFCLCADTVAITDFNGTGSSMAIRNINLTPSEPASLAILGLGALALGLVKRDRRGRHAALR